MDQGQTGSIFDLKVLWLHILFSTLSIFYVLYFYFKVIKGFTLFTHSTHTLLSFTHACCGKTLKYSLWICSVRSVLSVTSFSQWPRSFSDLLLSVISLSQWLRTLSEFVPICQKQWNTQNWQYILAINHLRKNKT